MDTATAMHHLYTLPPCFWDPCVARRVSGRLQKGRWEDSGPWQLPHCRECYSRLVTLTLVCQCNSRMEGQFMDYPIFLQASPWPQTVPRESVTCRNIILTGHRKLLWEGCVEDMGKLPSSTKTSCAPKDLSLSLKIQG